MKLYGYFRSSAAYRVRIALGLKGLAFEHAAVHLVKGEHRTQAFRAVNPQARVPALETDGGDILVQSPAILEYLEETHPEPPLLPRDPVARAHVRAVCAVIACDIHPLNNLSTLSRLKETLGADQAAVDAWYAHWITAGFATVEELIRPGPYAFGAEPGFADLYIVPQVFNARRFAVPLDAFPKIRGVAETCATHPAFAAAAPENQPDAA